MSTRSSRSSACRAFSLCPPTAKALVPCCASIRPRRSRRKTRIGWGMATRPSVDEAELLHLLDSARPDRSCGLVPSWIEKRRLNVSTSGVRERIGYLRRIILYRSQAAKMRTTARQASSGAHTQKSSGTLLSNMATSSTPAQRESLGMSLEASKERTERYTIQ